MLKNTRQVCFAQESALCRHREETDGIVLPVVRKLPVSLKRRKVDEGLGATLSETETTTEEEAVRRDVWVLSKQKEQEVSFKVSVSGWTDRK